MSCANLITLKHHASSIINSLQRGLHPLKVKITCSGSSEYAIWHVFALIHIVPAMQLIKHKSLSLHIVSFKFKHDNIYEIRRLKSPTTL